MTNWITDWIWRKPLGARGRDTVIATDDDEPDVLVGYGTWLHVDALATVDARHIGIDWFGVDVAYQRRKDDNGQSVAGVIYASLEAVARAHPDSTTDMPMTLVCHVENDRGRRFWPGFHRSEAHGRAK